MIKQQYDDGKKHVHVLSYGGGTQSTALLIKSLRDGINGVKPDFVIMSDTGWESKEVMDWGSEDERVHHGSVRCGVDSG